MTMLICERHDELRAELSHIKRWLRILTLGVLLAAGSGSADLVKVLVPYALAGNQ